MIAKKAPLFIFLLLAKIVFAQGANLNFNLALSGISGANLPLGEIRQNKASVIIFYSPECPICISTTKAVREMADSFARRGVRFYLVFPGKYYSNQEIKKFQKDYSLKMGSYRDESYALVKNLTANTTPQAFVIDPRGNVCYSGKIDNYYEEIGRPRTIVTKQFLRDAIEAVLQNRRPQIAKTEPIGCILNIR